MVDSTAMYIVQAIHFATMVVTPSLQKLCIANLVGSFHCIYF